MCGVCGVVGVKDAETSEALVRRMMNAMRHRGPDDEGMVVAPPVTLGMRRLSIIDLPGGGQPVFNEDGTAAVVFNGEIYNFPELRRTLEGRGHRFRTRSDTEAIVHAYEEWGVECVQHLRGMFAFAVVELDKESPLMARRVFLSRDRFGIKPLYYSFLDGALLFSSELKALLACGKVSPSLSPPSVYHYLLFGSVGEPMTIIDGVFSLPPGHRMLVVDCNRPAKQRPECYWNLALPRKQISSDGKNGWRDAARSLRRLLEESVRLHLRAEVPLGVFLSSGIDSTAMAALASREKSNILTLTVVFPEQEFSEADVARRTAQHLGTWHQELVLSGQEMLMRVDDALGGLDQPSIDGTNTYFVSWMARQVGLKVALSGLGSDEIFGGYSTFKWAPRLKQIAALARLVPNSLRAVTTSALTKIGERSRPGDAVRKLAALWRNPDGLPHPYFFARILFTPDQLRALLDGVASVDARPRWWAWLAEAAQEAGGLGSFGGVSHLETRSYMVNTLLRDTDAVSMAHSLEVRVPFLDHPLVEFVGQLPETIKRGRNRPKALLVEALGDLLPAEVANQRKRTFTFPWEHWLRGPLKRRVTEGLADLAPSLRRMLDRDAVQSQWQAFLEGRTSWSRPWSLYVLNEWAKRNLNAY